MVGYILSINQDDFFQSLEVLVIPNESPVLVGIYLLTEVLQHVPLLLLRPRPVVDLPLWAIDILLYVGEDIVDTVLHVCQRFNLVL